MTHPFPADMYSGPSTNAAFVGWDDIHNPAVAASTASIGPHPLDTHLSKPAGAPVVVRKKFAVPPVKVACLECRASRCRCDGNPIQCLNCSNRGKRCVYVQSKRGGSRIRKRKVASESVTVPGKNQDLNQAVLSILSEDDQATFAGPLSLVAPGGGLKQLDLLPEDTEFFLHGTIPTPDMPDSGYAGSEDAGVNGFETAFTPVPIRTYGSDEAILGAYYTYIHPYFPILPPPTRDQIYDLPDFGTRADEQAIFTSIATPDFEPDSPLSLAISANLALIPHPEDPDPAGAESVKIRREQAKAFAQVAYEAIEVESELAESNDNPSEALSLNAKSVSRQPFHPQNPVRNESVIALLLLSTFEYAQRGNVSKMKNRAGQALNAALDLGLHAKGNESGPFSEADRRTWWMAYIVACQGAILSNSEPPMLLYDPRFTTAYPTIGGDKDAWQQFLLAQQAITNATQFVIDLDIILKAQSDPSDIWARMLQLDKFLEPLITAANTWSAVPNANLETCVSQALRGMSRIKLNSARIKLHRYNAFSDIPVFSKKHCDLRSSNSAASPGCGCSNSIQELQNRPMNGSVISPGSSNFITPFGPFPFSSHTSANIAYQCAFNIADSYSKLPFPQPNQTETQQQLQPTASPRLSTSSKYPRMIPIFSCCAMQSSYAMIMLYHRSKKMGLITDRGDGVVSMSQNKLYKQLELGLNCILKALQNYGIAYEAVGGMRDQIENAIQSLGFQQI